MTDPRDEWLRTGGGIRALPDAQAEHIRQLTGRVLGGYRVTGLVGSGGMGLVLRAERAEGDFERTVAIKLVPGVSPATDVARRFQTERQILAGLNHPCIAQLYDGGQTEEGWPYLVMEYVDGLPVDDYCRQQDLSTDERVRLLARITDAVAFAHARLVVHRDIKPSNVLVTRDGNPKLLDFGIAKLLDPATTQETRGERLLTPQYASPEQLLGSPITTGSDIYQLGALYLSVLADEPPFSETSLEEAVNRAASGREVQVSEDARRDIPSDLIAIVEKCLRAEPGDRYPDVGAVRTDLLSYLEGYPVSARRGATLYRLRKLVTRNKAASTFALAALLIAVGGSVIYAVDLREAREVAEARARTAERVLHAMSELITDTYSELMETSGLRRQGNDPDSDLQNEPLRLVLERTTRLIERSLVDEPRLRAELLRVQGMTNRELNRPGLARTQLAEALEASMRVADTDLGMSVLAELVRVGLYDGDRHASETHLNQGLALMERHAVSAPAAADLYSAAARFEEHRGNFQAAAEYGLKAIELLESLPGQRGIPLARAYAGQASIYGQLEAHQAVRAYALKAAAIYEKIEGPQYRGLISAYSELGRSHFLAGEYEAALGYAQRSLRVSRANFGEHHLRTVRAYNNVAVTARRMGDIEGSLESLMRARAIAEEIAPDNLLVQIRLLTSIGNAYESLGELDRAAEEFERGLAIDGLAKAYPKQYAFLLNNYGNLLALRGETARGAGMLREAASIKSRVMGEVNPSTARSLLQLVQSQIRTGHDTDAAVLLKQAERAYKEAFGSGHPKMAYLHLVRGQYLRSQGALDDATAEFRAGLEGRLHEYDEKHVRTTEILVELALTALMAGDEEAARRWLSRAAPGIADMPASIPERVEAAVVVAEVAAATEAPADAARAKSEALALVGQTLPGRDDLTRRLAAL
ncbi:MAG: tetratricopeptide repeat protein [Gammaproteobacteria bacterium]